MFTMIKTVVHETKNTKRMKSFSLNNYQRKLKQMFNGQKQKMECFGGVTQCFLQALGG